MGNGGCSCTDFGTRCQVNFRDNGGHVVDYWMHPEGKPNPKRTRCKHITAAYKKDQDDRLLRLAQKEARQDPQNSAQR